MLRIKLPTAAFFPFAVILLTALPAQALLSAHPPITSTATTTSTSTSTAATLALWRRQQQQQQQQQHHLQEKFSLSSTTPQNQVNDPSATPTTRTTTTIPPTAFVAATPRPTRGTYATKPPTLVRMYSHLFYRRLVLLRGQLRQFLSSRTVRRSVVTALVAWTGLVWCPGARAQHLLWRFRGATAPATTPFWKTCLLAVSQGLPTVVGIAVAVWYTGLDKMEKTLTNLHANVARQLETMQQEQATHYQQSSSRWMETLQTNQAVLLQQQQQLTTQTLDSSFLMDSVQTTLESVVPGAVELGLDRLYQREWQENLQQVLRHEIRHAPETTVVADSLQDLHSHVRDLQTKLESKLDRLETEITALAAEMEHWSHKDDDSCDGETTATGKGLSAPLNVWPFVL